MKQINDKTDGYNEIDSQGLQSAKAFFTDFYTFCLSNPQAMNGLIIVFVFREEWGTAITVIETNYKVSNLIPCSFFESTSFWCKLYHNESKFSANYEHRTRK